tara:strand:+ start:811 stop:1704 length:894 start_codon:yes stop_codon:yes gene_type:complete
MATPNIVPRANGEGGIGSAAKGWGEAFVTNTTTTSATEGGKLVLAANDGSTMENAHRLGVIEFKGAEDGSGTLTTGARIQAVTEATWSGTENGCGLQFWTTDGNASEAANFSISSDGAVRSENTLASKNYRTIWIDAGSMVPTVTNGALAATEEVTNTFDYYAFDTSTAEKVQFKMPMPEQWDGGTIKAKFYFLPSNTNTGTVQFSIAGTSLDTGDIISTAMGTAVVHTALAANGTDNDVHITAATAACTIAGSPAEGHLVLFEIARVTATDTYNADIHLLGVNIQYRETNTASAAW